MLRNAGFGPFGALLCPRVQFTQFSLLYYCRDLSIFSALDREIEVVVEQELQRRLWKWKLTWICNIGLILLFYANLNIESHLLLRIKLQ